MRAKPANRPQHSGYRSIGLPDTHWGWWRVRAGLIKMENVNCQQRPEEYVLGAIQKARRSWASPKSSAQRNGLHVVDKAPDPAVCPHALSSDARNRPRKDPSKRSSPAPSFRSAQRTINGCRVPARIFNPTAQPTALSSCFAPVCDRPMRKRNLAASWPHAVLLDFRSHRSNYKKRTRHGSRIPLKRLGVREDHVILRAASIPESISKDHRPRACPADRPAGAMVAVSLSGQIISAISCWVHWQKPIKRLRVRKLKARQNVCHQRSQPPALRL